jgi:hypothetical protein
MTEKVRIGDLNQELLPEVYRGILANIETHVSEKDMDSLRNPEKRIKRRERILEQHKKYKDVPFTICRRTSDSNLLDMVPWDKMDWCYFCNETVWYDSRHSEGKVHVCQECAGDIIRESKLGRNITENFGNRLEQGRNEVELYESISRRSVEQNISEGPLKKKTEAEMPGQKRARIYAQIKGDTGKKAKSKLNFSSKSFLTPYIKRRS